MAEPEKPAAPPPPAKDPAVQKALDETSLVKARADARKAEADADTAAAAARTASFKAAWGEIPAAPYSGEVKENDGAALAEQNYLVRGDLVKIAVDVSREILAHAKGKHVYLTGEAAVPSTSVAQTFDLQKDLVTRSLRDAIAVSRALDADEDDSADLVPLAAVGLALTSLSAVLSYAKSDYTLGGRTLSPSGTALLGAVGDYLAKSGKSVCLAPFTPQADAAARKNLIDEFAIVSQLAVEARERAAKHAARIKALSPKEVVPPKPGVAPTPAPDPDPNNEKPLHEHALGALTPAIGLFDAMQTSLLSVTDGASGAQKILEARAVASFMTEKDAIVAVVTIDGAYASTVSDKGLFSSVGGSIPYKISTYVDASWRCFNASTMMFVGGGTERQFSPLKHISDIE